MKQIIAIFIIITSFSRLHSQSLIGIPFLDKCRKIGECEMCKNPLPETKKFMDSLEIVLKPYYVKNDKIKMIQAYNVIDSNISELRRNYNVYKEGRNPEKEILGRLLLIKMQYLVLYIVEKDGVIYNLNASESLHYPNYLGVKEICDIFDEIIKLNLSEKTNEHIRNLRLEYIYQSGASYEIDPDNFDWLEKSDLKSLKNNKNVSKEKLEIATIFVNEMKESKYEPFSSYTAFGIGLAGGIGKSSWIGYEFSDDMVDKINPFRRNSISGSPYVRFNYLSTSFLINLNDNSKQDLLFSVFNFRNPLIHAKLIQFGFHSGISDKLKWFYRPEIGVSYGIFHLSYSYNLAFDKTIRSLAEKNMLTFGISYPLIRIGGYE
ncbi:MAG: hypothetical protein ACKO7P_15810 [Bacteroidota bacterium]